jgi:hypothetical protein
MALITQLVLENTIIDTMHRTLFNNFKGRGYHFLIGICLLLLNAGCTANGVRKGHPEEIIAVKKSLQNNKPEAAYTALNHKLNSKDRLLFLEERGRVASIQGNFQDSIKDFEAASNLIDVDRSKAFISVGHVVATSASILTSDTAIPYKSPPYELVFINTFQALNYLANGDLEGALVELRKAENEQIYALATHSKALAKAEAQAQEQKLDPVSINRSLRTAYQQMDSAVHKIKNSFQNAYTYYLAGTLYERSKNFNDAYIDYKKALELSPENSYCIQSAMRLAQLLGFKDEYTDIKKRYALNKNYLASGSSQPTNQDGAIVILYEEGFVPEKTEIKLPLIFNGKTYTIVMPCYADNHYMPLSLSVYKENEFLGNTEIICSVKALAVKALTENYFGIMVRQMERLVAKHVIQKQLQKNDDVISLIAGIANLLLENADRRSWLTLPDNIQIAHFQLPSGSHTLSFKANTTTVLATKEVVVTPNHLTLIRIVKTGSAFYIKAIH